MNSSTLWQVAADTLRKQQWEKLLKVFEKAGLAAKAKIHASITPAVAGSSFTRGGGAVEISNGHGHETVSKAVLRFSSLTEEWSAFLNRVERFRSNLSKLRHGFAFAFADGLLTRAMKEGLWLLLDEINLASQETLQSLTGVLDGRSLRLTESGDLEPIARSPDFRIFAAMNPPTDVGKRELSAALRSRFTELYVEELTDPADLQSIVEG